MDCVALLGGGAPRMVRAQVAATLAAGTIALAPAANGAGLAVSTTTSLADAVGLIQDGTFVAGNGQPVSGTYQTAQQSDNSDPSRLVTVIINPDQVLRAFLSGGATAGTALTLYPVTTASATGLAVTTASEWSSPTYDEGVVWGYDGANAGIARKITSVSSTAGTVTVAFPFDTVVGDNFLRAPFYPFQTATLQLTSDLTQVDASIAVGTGGSARVIGHQYGSGIVGLRDASEEGRTRSFVEFILNDHVLKDAT